MLADGVRQQAVQHYLEGMRAVQDKPKHKQAVQHVQRMMRQSVQQMMNSACMASNYRSYSKSKLEEIRSMKSDFITPMVARRARSR